MIRPDPDAIASARINIYRATAVVSCFTRLGLTGRRPEKPGQPAAFPRQLNNLKICLKPQPSTKQFG